MSAEQEAVNVPEETRRPFEKPAVTWEIGMDPSASFKAACGKVCCDGGGPCDTTPGS
jgi:hypothetical protein